MTLLFCILFLGSYLDLLFFMFGCLLFFYFLFIGVRGTMPRFRYDKLMYTAWKSFLPVSLNYLCLFWEGAIRVFLFSLL